MVNRVLIAQLGSLPHYRLRFFEELTTLSEEREWRPVFALEQGLLTGQNLGFSIVTDSKALAQLETVGFRTRRLPGGLVWQGLLPLGCSGVKALITDTQIGNLTYGLAPLVARVRGLRWGAWGHGRDRQAANHSAQCSFKSLAESLKRRWIRQARQFFAYTPAEARFAVDHLGFSPDRVTLVQNTIDVVSELARADFAREQLTKDWPGYRTRILQELGLTVPPLDRAESRVLLSVGRFIPQRQMARLIPIVDELFQRQPDLVWIMIGDGPDRSLFKPLQARWPRRLLLPGTITDSARLAQLYAVADAYILYGLVGLGVVQACAHGLPTIYWAEQGHSPEVEYCTPANSVALPGQGEGPQETHHLWRAISEFSLPTSPLESRLARRHAIAQTVAPFTIEAMAENFADGIDRLMR